MASMMTQDRDYEDILRQALASAAESIEPTGDGLRRIRHRLDSRRSPRSALSGFAEWLELHASAHFERPGRLRRLFRGAEGSSRCQQSERRCRWI